VEVVRQAGEERAEPWQQRRVEPRRQLEEQRAEPLAERRDAGEELGDLGACIDEQPIVGDRARELEAEPEARGT